MQVLVLRSDSIFSGAAVDVVMEVTHKTYYTWQCRVLDVSFSDDEIAEFWVKLTNINFVANLCAMCDYVQSRTWTLRSTQNSVITLFDYDSWFVS